MKEGNLSLSQMMVTMFARISPRAFSHFFLFRPVIWIPCRVCIDIVSRVICPTLNMIEVWQRTGDELNLRKCRMLLHHGSRWTESSDVSKDCVTHEGKENMSKALANFPSSFVLRICGAVETFGKLEKFIYKRFLLSLYTFSILILSSIHSGTASNRSAALNGEKKSFSLLSDSDSVLWIFFFIPFGWPAVIFSCFFLWKFFYEEFSFHLRPTTIHSTIASQSRGKIHMKKRKFEIGSLSIWLPLDFRFSFWGDSIIKNSFHSDVDKKNNGIFWYF